LNLFRSTEFVVEEIEDFVDNLLLIILRPIKNNNSDPAPPVIPRSIILFLKEVLPWLILSSLILSFAAILVGPEKRRTEGEIGKGVRHAYLC
jgi:hypothetical protein